ncbi:alkaline phosphatase family protein [Arthrobacter dokdonensis]|uniref:alkaline phosphatase family protein n=1 Tax=Arthrobacter dokdonellae TaxID=2211210 RepID=UPI000DE5C13A|nr:alkaline phosphatase family protein [Arthrobacter dokdonellae]
MAKAGTLPQICYVWSPAGYDAHAPHVSTPDYVTKGHNLVWDRVQAVIDGTGWADTTFILTWDDWGGYTDSIPESVQLGRAKSIGRRAPPGSNCGLDCIVPAQ